MVEPRVWRKSDTNTISPRGIHEPPGIAAMLEKTSPFRGAAVGETGARDIHPNRRNKLLGWVKTRPPMHVGKNGIMTFGDPLRYDVALVCQHWAPNGVCRMTYNGKSGCEAWQEAVAERDEA